MGLRVVGDSMTKASIAENAVAVIHKTSDFDNGNIVVAIINNDAGTLKRVYKRPDGIYLEPDSYDPIYKPFPYTEKHIKDEDPSVIIVGVYLYSVSGII
ncbi:LexA family protein [Oenococcus kitaharae]|nr:S24 family peptidase [Oenococcus kitaharae]